MTSSTDAGQLGLLTDASGSICFGGFFQGQWFQGHWSNMQNLPHNLSIAFKEHLPIVFTIILKGEDWKKRKLVFYSDDQCTVDIIHKKNPPAALYYEVSETIDNSGNTRELHIRR